MKGLAHILSKFSFGTIQDQGRKGYLNQGIYEGGPMDREAARLTNYYCDNHDTDALFEMNNVDFEILFSHTTTVCLSVPSIVNSLEKPPYKAFNIHDDEVLLVKYTKDTPWRYLAVTGGWQTPKVLGSRGTNPALHLLPLHHLDTISYTAQCLSSRNTLLGDNVVRRLPFTQQIDIDKGPEFHLFSTHLRLDQEFTIAANSSRMAYTFEEGYAVPYDMPSMHSRAVTQGTMQLTPSGKIFVLMRDCQTTGGYPRLGMLPEKSIDLLARVPLGQKIKFNWV